MDPRPTLRRLWPVLLLGLLVPDLAKGQGARRGPAAAWVGQDGHDFVGPNSALAPSGVQDIHIRLQGLPPNRTITHAKLTGLGGDEWQYGGPHGPYKAHIVRRDRAPAADLYVEPTRVETGRGFTLTLTYDDGRTAELNFPGGKADPNRRMAAAQLKARWIGQDGRDRTGPGPSVGPDGQADVVLALENLVPKVEIKAVSVRAPGGVAWQSGVNPKALPNAELIRDPADPSKAVVFLQPDRDRAGQNLAVGVLYANDQTDETTVKAGAADPKRAVAAPKRAAIAPLKLTSRWLGQDGTDAAGPGSVHVSLDGLPATEIVGAALSDPVGGCWVFKARDDVPLDAATYPMPLIVRRDGPARADLAFAPIRDESGGNLVLRLRFADGREGFADIPGGPADPTRRVATAPEATSVTAKPGDDLNELAGRFGTIRLAKGTHALDRPLTLPRPIQLIGEPGATLKFSQPAGAEPWTAAIKVHAGPTTLDGFAVRFGGPVRWRPDINYGPAVIGTTDNHDPGQHPLKANLTFRRLDLESPPPSSDWEEATRLIRLATAENGAIVENTLRGGMIEFLGGPWRIEQNAYRGTPPGTFNFGVFSGHRTHDLIVRGNTARSEGPSGKTWRFLVLTVSGASDLVADNRVADVGPRDDDTRQDNAPEIILTEAYRLRFEGRPQAIAAGGRVLHIGEPQGDPAEPGDVVALLDGPAAGQYRRVAQRIDRGTYLLAEPLPKEAGTVSIATGFVGERFEGNTVDGRGGSVAAGFVLVGNHFGTRVAKNRVLGCGEAIRFTAAPTEFPGPWGWSHAPALGVTIEGNTIDSSLKGVTIEVEHGPPVKSSRGRVYLTATVRDNVFQGAAPARAAAVRPKGDDAGPPPVLRLGDPRAVDAGEAVVSASGNRREGPGAGVMAVHATTLNGTAVTRARLPLDGPAGAGAGPAQPPKR